LFQKVLSTIEKGVLEIMVLESRITKKWILTLHRNMAQMETPN
jgi:hypothetical protein